MKTAIPVTYWVAIVMMVAGLATFWVACIKIKKTKITKMAALLSCLCVVLGIFVTYMYINYFGYLTIIFSLLTLWYGVMMLVMGIQFIKPQKISKEFVVALDKEKEKTNLLYVSYTVAGNMLGSQLNISLQVDKSNPKIVSAEIHEKESAEGYENVIKKKITPICCLSLENIIDKYGICEWASLPLSDIVATDSNVRTLDIWYRDGNQYHVSDMQKLPEEYVQAFEDIKNCIFEYAGKKTN